jgi:hypothetical protein
MASDGVSFFRPQPEFDQAAAEIRSARHVLLLLARRNLLLRLDPEAIVVPDRQGLTIQ